MRTLMGSHHTLSTASKQPATAAERGGWIRCWFRRFEPPRLWFRRRDNDKLLLSSAAQGAALKRDLHRDA
ncbi:unnamed protein product [Ectocarpus sp. CCAP 1310/34]|nr:unnamed protein product [Ectocarpus sp. CCAP 1310/34]